MDKSRIVGIDYGLARIGIAVSDESKLIASTYLTLRAERKLEMTAEKLIAQLEELKKEKQCSIETIVIGMPLMMSGKMGMLADEVKLLAALLHDKTGIPVVTLRTAQCARYGRNDAFGRLSLPDQKGI